MAKTIWKYALEPEGDTTLRVPCEADLLYLAVQNGHPFVWMRVDTDAQVDEIRRFTVVGTGHEVRAGLLYRGSFMLMEGAFVGHVFEAVPMPPEGTAA